MTVSVVGTVVEYRNTVGATTQSTSIGSVASGDGIVVVTLLNSATITVSSVDVGSATGVTQIGTSGVFTGALAGDRWTAHFYENSTQTGTLSVDVNLSASENPRIFVWRVQGHNTGAYSGNAANGQGSGTAPSINLSVSDNSAIFGFLSTVSDTNSPGTNYVLHHAPADNSPGAWYIYLERDLDAGTTGSKAVDFSTTDESWGVFAFEIKVAAAGNSAAPSAGALVIAGQQPVITLSAGAPITKYAAFVKNFMLGVIDLDSHTIKGCAVTSSYTPDAAHTQLSSVSANRVSGTTDATLTGVTVDETGGVATWDANDLTLTFPSGGTPKYVVLYDDTAANDELIGYVTLPDATTVDAGAGIKLVWAAAGIGTLT